MTRFSEFVTESIANQRAKITSKNPLWRTATAATDDAAAAVASAPATKAEGAPATTDAAPKLLSFSSPNPSRVDSAEPVTTAEAAAQPAVPRLPNHIVGAKAASGGRVTITDRTCKVCAMEVPAGDFFEDKTCARCAVGLRTGGYGSSMRCDRCGVGLDSNTDGRNCRDCAVRSVVSASFVHANAGGGPGPAGDDAATRQIECASCSSDFEVRAFLEGGRIEREGGQLWWFRDQSSSGLCPTTTTSDVTWLDVHPRSSYLSVAVSSPPAPFQGCAYRRI